MVQNLLACYYNDDRVENHACYKPCYTSLTLSLRRGGGGGGLLQPPLSDFPSCRFCVFAKIAIRSIYPPFVQIPMYL